MKIKYIIALFFMTLFVSMRLVLAEGASPEMKVESYVKGPTLKLEIKNTLKEEPKTLQVTEVLLKKENVEVNRIIVDEFKNKSLIENEVYRQEIAEAVASGKSQQEIENIRNEYLGKRTKMLQQVKKEQQQLQQKNAQDVQDLSTSPKINLLQMFQQKITGTIQKWLPNLFRGENQ